MDDFRTERVGGPPQVSDTLTPEPGQQSAPHRQRRAKTAPLPASKPQEDQQDPEPDQDDAPHEIDELA